MEQILLKIHEISKTGSRNNRLIAQYILEHKEEVLSSSVQTLAKKINVSDASIPRFARAIGLDGFPAFKIALSASIAVLPKVNDFKEVEEFEAVTEIKNKVSLRVEHMLQQINEKLANSEIEKAVKTMMQTDVLYIYGIGASGLVAQDIFQKFTRLGKLCMYISDVHIFLSAIHVHSNKATLILISQSGEKKETIKIAKAVEKLDIPIIGITSKENSSLGKRADIVLNSTSGEAIPIRAAATMSLMSQLYVVDILFYSFLSQNMAIGEQNIRHTREIVDHFDRL